MPTIFKPLAANPTLFTEIVRTTLDVDPVIAFYATAVVAMTAFWAFGCLAFGRVRNAG